MMPFQAPDSSQDDGREVQWQKVPTYLADYRKQRDQSHGVSYRKKQLPWDSPNTPDDIDEAIAASRYMLGWEDDWDGEGSPAYRQDTWERATEFAERNVRMFRHRRHVPAPVIETGADGGVDIRLEVGNRKVVISVPANIDEPATIYGKDTSRTPPRIISGHQDTDRDAGWILLWLTE